MSTNLVHMLLASLFIGFSVTSAIGQTEMRTLYLKDGGAVKGRIVAQDDSTVVFETQYGTLEIRRGNILRMEVFRELSPSPDAREPQTVYLKDGAAIRGILTYESQDTVTVETSYGRMNIPRATIQRIGTRPLPSAERELEAERRADVPQLSTLPQSTVWEVQHNLGILGGVSLPVGELGATTGGKAGLATTGFCAGLEYTCEASRNFSIGLAGLLTSNSLDEEKVGSASRSYLPGSNMDAGSWFLIWIVGEIGFTVPLSPSSSFYARGLLGGLFGNSPELTLTYSGVHGSVKATQSSASTEAFAFGAATGVVVANRVDIGLRFVTAEPEYDITAQASSGTQTATSSGKLKQPTSVLQIAIGIFVN